MALVYDVFSYNGERDMLHLHLGALTKHVDKFVIVEAKTTFTGAPKPLYFFRQQRYFQEFWPKIEYHVINENYHPGLVALAESSPNTQGAAHWKREFMQKESIHYALNELHLKDNDLVYIGDVDEIWEPYDGPYPAKLKLKVYAYYLNNRSSEEFWGTFVAPYGYLKDKCLNHLRTAPEFRSETFSGYHFTSMGGTDEVRRKLNASYTAESYNTPEVQSLLAERVEAGTDYLGRPFSFRIEEDWPLFLKENRKRFSHLLR